MSYLRSYPFSSLKIDREFVEGIGHAKADRELVKATIAMTKGLGINVMAEGVETAEQAALLAEWDCDLAQGYWYSAPKSMSELPATLANLEARHLSASVV